MSATVIAMTTTDDMDGGAEPGSEARRTTL
jgi:hypothetical protein